MTKKTRSGNSNFLILALIIVLGFSWLSQLNQGKPMDYSEVRQLFEQEKVESFTFSDSNHVVLSLRGEEDPVRYQIYSFELFYDDLNELVQEQKAKGVITSYNYPPPETTNWLELVLPWVVTAVVFGAVWYFLMARGQGGGDRMAKFGNARTRTPSAKDKKVTFRDVAGADEEKEELQEIVEFMRDPKKFMTLGARIPKGVLLVGPPVPVRLCWRRRWLVRLE